jgi:O-antigen biosynthesis protein
VSALVAVLVGCGLLLLVSAVVLGRLVGEVGRQRRTIRRLRRRSARQQSRLLSLEAKAAATAAAATAPPQREHVPHDPLRDVSSRAIEVVDRLVFDGDKASVVLLLHGFGTESLFAGVRTAVVVAAKLADALSLSLRVVVVDEPTGLVEDLRKALVELVRDDARCPEVADALRLSVHGSRIDDGHSAGDVWVATYWTTAFAADHLVGTGRISATRVVYLIQDFEPGFYPWGDLYAKAWSTYDAGFTLLVNSSSLARFVEDTTGLVIPPAQVIGPALDVSALTGAAAAWSPDAEGLVRVLFYARPSKGRNMYITGLQALRCWADRLPEHTSARVSLAGEPVEPVDLGDRVEVETLGKVSYADYYELLSRTDVGLALMHSPHPGHLALEMALAGIPTVTNEFQGYRVPWVTNLTVAGSSPDALAQALSGSWVEASALTGHRPGGFLQDLGTTVDAAVAALAPRWAEVLR